MNLPLPRIYSPPSSPSSQLCRPKNLGSFLTPFFLSHHILNLPENLFSPSSKYIQTPLFTTSTVIILSKPPLSLTSYCKSPFNFLSFSPYSSESYFQHSIWSEPFKNISKIMQLLCSKTLSWVPNSPRLKIEVLPITHKSLPSWPLLPPTLPGLLCSATRVLPRTCQAFSCFRAFVLARPFTLKCHPASSSWLTPSTPVSSRRGLSWPSDK